MKPITDSPSPIGDHEQSNRKPLDANGLHPPYLIQAYLPSLCRGATKVSPDGVHENVRANSRAQVASNRSRLCSLVTPAAKHREIQEHTGVVSA